MSLKSAAKSRYYPQLAKDIHPQIKEETRYVRDALYDLRDSSQWQIQNLTLSKNSAFNPDVTPGKPLLLIAQQNAVGGFTLTFDPKFKGTTPTIAPAANALTLSLFYPRSEGEVLTIAGGGGGGGGVPPTRLISTTLPLTGGGDLSADRTLGINVFTGAVNGAVPAPGVIVGNVLSDSGAWVALAGGGTVTSVSQGTGITCTPNPIVGVGTVALATRAANSIMGNNTGGVLTPLDLTGTQVTAMLDQFTSILQGIVPASGGGVANFLRADVTWAVPPSGPHNIFSATHTDTTGAAAPVDGDLILGNVTPLWSKLAISIPAANVRNVLGIDNGELRPSWKTALDATAPTTIGVSDVAAAGTSLVFSHRDHQHGSPATFPAERLIEAIHQVGHGFAAGDAIYYTGAAWAKAKSDAATTLGIGIVSVVAGADDFTLCMAGHITGLGGLTAGQYYYVDAVTAGALTAVEPATYSNPLLFAESAATGIVLQYRPSASQAGFTQGSVLFIGASGTPAQDNANLFWDDGNNRLGIGTAAPTSPITISANATTPPAPVAGTLFHVVAADAANAIFGIDDFAAASVFLFRRANNTNAAPQALALNDQIFQLQARGYGATAYSGSRISLVAIATEAWSDTVQGTSLTLTTTPLGTAAAKNTLAIQAGQKAALGATDAIQKMTGAVTDGYSNSLGLIPAYDQAFTVTRHNYLDLNNPTLTNSAVVTDAAVMRFDAAKGTHKALLKDGYITVNENATLRYLPMMGGLNAQPLNKNFLNNGNFNIWQRGTTQVSLTSGAAAYMADRWVGNHTSDAVYKMDQEAAVLPTVAQSGVKSLFSLKASCTTADASIAAGQFATLGQKVEGFNVQPLMGRVVTLSFWVYSSKAAATGSAPAYCVSFRNSGSDRSYVAEYHVEAANTWEKKSVTLTMLDGTAGTWDFSTGVGLAVNWSLACGATFRAAQAGDWETGNFLGTTNQVNWLDSNTAVFYLSQAQLEIGGVATDFDPIPHQVDLAKCQRYFFEVLNDGTNTSKYFGYGISQSTTAAIINVKLPITMRATPSFITSATGDTTLSDGTTATAATSIALSNVINQDQNLVSLTVGTGATLTAFRFYHARLTVNSGKYVGFSADL